MLFALIVVVILAIGLLVTLLLNRSSAAEFRAQAEQRETAWLAERDQLNDDVARLERDLGGAREEVEQRNSEVSRQAGELRRVGGELDKARSVTNERIESQSTEIAALVSDNNELQSKLETTELARAEATEAAAAAEARNAGVAIGQLPDVGGSRPGILWDLEVVRSERTWRTSVAVDPSAPIGPFEGTDDPVRLAVEIEAAALRENVGAFITIDWRATPIADPAQRHLVVRVAQEMLEAAARNPEPLRLVAVDDDDDEVILRLEPAESDAADATVAIAPPRLAGGDLIDVRDDLGLNVTVKAE